MGTSRNHVILPIAHVHSILKQRAGAPKQGSEGAPDARLKILPDVVQGLDGIRTGQEIVILTWLHEAQRDVLKVHPRGEAIDGTPVIDTKPVLAQSNDS